MNKKNRILIFVAILIIAIVGIVLISQIMSEDKEEVTNSIEYHINIDTGDFETIENDEESKVIESDEETKEISNTDIELIPLNIIETEDITGGQLLHVNDYKIVIEQKLVEMGYDTSIEDNVLTISSKDNSYKCTVLQLSDNYVMPTEEEQDAFWETEEYKKWDEEEYGDDENAFDIHMEKYDEIYSNYYKKLGYTAKNSPNYVLTEKERMNIIDKYILEGENNSNGSNGLFPGYEYYNNYDWGKVTLYAIPKYYNDSTFGEKTSDISVCIYFIEHYDVNEESFVELWTL